MGAYELVLIVIGLALLGAAIFPRLLANKPLSFPIVYVGLGFVLFTVTPGASALDPVGNPVLTERLTELVIIISLMGAGLKLDRPLSVSNWAVTWRLLGIALPLTAAAVAVLAWGVLGLLPATAILLGAVLAPTDAVLASGVEAEAPFEGLDDDGNADEQGGTVRFALTSEAGVNDGLAFPLTNLAIVVAGVSLGEGWTWIADWVLVDVLYKIGAGIVLGHIIGQLMARLLFQLPGGENIADFMGHGEDVMVGVEALATTLIAYGVTQLLGGYGFIAVFVASLSLRYFEWEHDYYLELYDFAVLVERVLMATVLVLFGGALAGGLLAPLTLGEALLGLALVFVIRPVAGIVSFIGTDTPWADRATIAFFGIRGIGSFYYLSYALAESSFEQLELVAAAEELWAFVGFVVLTSVLTHGISASPVMNALDRWHDRYRQDAANAD